MCKVTEKSLKYVKTSIFRLRDVKILSLSGLKYFKTGVAKNSAAKGLRIRCFKTSHKTEVYAV